MEEQVRELMVEQLKDTFSAEKQALRCMQKAVRKASIPALRDGIQMHIEQTQVQIERVEQIMESLKIRPGRKVCEAMRGLVEEAQQEIGEHEKGPVLDLVIVAGMQRIEHYEIAAYGTNIAIARALGEQEAVGLLSETLEEEKQTDLKLTEVTERYRLARLWRVDRARALSADRRPDRRHPKSNASGHAGCKSVAAASRTYSPFAEPQLHQSLQDRKINSIVITGGETDVCVLAAVLDAVDLGYRVIVASDALCSVSDEAHDNLLQLFSGRFQQQIEVASSHTILEAWLSPSSRIGRF